MNKGIEYRLRRTLDRHLGELCYTLNLDGTSSISIDVHNGRITYLLMRDLSLLLGTDDIHSSVHQYDDPDDGWSEAETTLYVEIDRRRTLSQ